MRQFQSTKPYRKALTPGFIPGKVPLGKLPIPQVYEEGEEEPAMVPRPCCPSSITTPPTYRRKRR